MTAEEARNHTAGYDAEFYTDIAAGSRRSAGAILPIVTSWLRPTSMIDVGCGVGTWLAAAAAPGLALVGIDGDHVPRHLLRIAGEHFRCHDLRSALPSPEQRFDLAISMEVAEHLDEARATSFVADLCALSDVVLFSAAIPGQGGQDHINEQWPSWWAQRFSANGYRAIDIVRPAVWDDDGVEFWYRQNTLLYVSESRQDLLAAVASSGCTIGGGPLDVVHPHAWRYTSELLARERRGTPGVRLATAHLASATRVAVRTRSTGSVPFSAGARGRDRGR